MPSIKPQSKVYLTPAQAKAEAEAIRRSSLTASQFRRLALKLACEAQGVTFPDNMPGHGGVRDPQQ